MTDAASGNDFMGTEPHSGESNTFRAQFGEDRLLDRFFASKRNGFYVEVGAYDGVQISNTYHFEQIGWTGVLVEPDPEMAQACERSRPRSCVVNCAAVEPGSPSQVSFDVATDLRDHSSLSLDQAHRRRIQGIVGRLGLRRIVVPALTLDEILVRCSASEIDFISIDVEGHELAVLRGFSPDKWKPKIIIVERNSELPNLAILRYMQRAGYVYLRTTAAFRAMREGANGANDWFAMGPGGARRLGYWFRVAARLYLPRLIGFVGRRVKKAARRAFAGSATDPD